MTITMDLLDLLAKDFDDRMFPVTAYLTFLDGIAGASNGERLCEVLCIAISWKDGKVRSVLDGNHGEQGETADFTVKRARPNTLDDRHRQVFRTPEFYAWADTVRQSRHFDPRYIVDLSERFGLWQSIVLPVFVLHCLQPRVFPLVDQHVMRSFRMLSSGVLSDAIDLQGYVQYREWWLKVIAEAGLTPLGANLDRLKQIDAGVWVLGKALRGMDFQNGEAEPVAPPRRRGRRNVGTGSGAFKLRAVELATALTQRDAVVQAAREFGIELPPSYEQYPGVHFARWRQQGFT